MQVAMARCMAKHSGEADFAPVHPDKCRPPHCDRCEEIAYIVFQATCCGAYFCTGCKNAQSQFLGQPAYQTCPKCYRRLGPGDIVYDYNEIQKRNQFVVHCRNKQAGCSYKDKRGQMDAHLLSCLYELVSCKHGKCDKKVYRKDFQYHHETCPDRMVQCQYCKDPLRASHYDTWHLYHGCQDFPKDCPNNCGEKVTDRMRSKHKEVCPCEPIPCLFTGCTETVQRSRMSQHLSGYKHMEFLLSGQADMRRAICSLQTELQKSREREQSLETTVHTLKENYSRRLQSLETTVQTLKDNYYRRLLEDVGNLKQSQSNLQSQIHCNHQLANQAGLMEKNFQLHKKAFENFMDECRAIQDSITQASVTPPFKFIINNTDELAGKGDSHSSPPFYTECRRHKLKLVVFPGGKGNAKDSPISVCLYRIRNFGVPCNTLPERVKIKVVIELVSQLPHAIEADNYVVTIDTIVHRDQQEELIFEMNEFIPATELDYFERKRRFSFSRHTQYKVDNSLVFQVRSAIESIL